jgi:hypothetical protein
MDVLNILPMSAQLPIRGVLWIAEQIQEEAEKQFFGEEAIRRALTELELKLDLGEISEDVYMAQEEQLLARLKVARERARQAAEDQA